MRGLQLSLTTLTLLLLLSAGPAQAQARAGGGPCQTDVEKLCKDVKPAEGAIAKCLKQNEANVSPGCKDAMAQAHEKMQAFTKACGGDVQQYCKGAKRGQGRLLKCLKENEAKLSEGCRAAMQEAHGAGGQQ